MKILAATVFALSSLALAAPASAMGLVEAVLQCGNTPGCSTTPSGGGGVVITGPTGGVVECYSPQTECFVLTHGSRVWNGEPPKAGPVMSSLSSSNSSEQSGGTGGSFVVMGSIYTPSPVQ